MRKRYTGVFGLLLAMTTGCAGPAVQRAAGPAPAPAPAPVDLATEVPAVTRLSDPAWVEVRLSVVAGDEESIAHARARALGRARVAAAEFVSGVTVRSGVLSFQAVRDQDSSELVEVLSQVFAEAVVVDERVAAEQVSPLPGGGFRLDLALRAKVVDRRGPDSDPSFEVEVRLPRERFLDGEEVTFEVRSTRPARLYVFSVYRDGAALLVPNEYEPDIVAPAGAWVRFPSQALLDRGVRVVARLPEGARSSPESLLVVAVGGDQRLSDVRPKAGQVFRQAQASGSGRLLYDLIGPLAALPPSQWALAQQAYWVLSR